MESKTKQAAKSRPTKDVPFPHTGLSPALQRTIKAKIERDEIDEIDEIDYDVFEENLRKTVKKCDQG